MKVTDAWSERYSAIRVDDDRGSMLVIPTCIRYTQSVGATAYHLEQIHVVKKRVEID